MSRPNPPLSSARVSLSCLDHPVSVAAIAMLLVNDQRAPGSRTCVADRKLGDLAGLFVFPYLVTLALISVVSNTDRGRLDHTSNRKKPYGNMAL